MELDEMKQAWQMLDRRLAQQHALQRQMFVERRLDGLRRGLRPLIWGQSIQIAFGVVFLWIGVAFWTTHMPSVPWMLCGMLVQVFGIALIAFAARILFLVRDMDYAAPVLRIQKRMASLRRWRVRVEAPVFAVLGSIIWVPLVLMLVQRDFEAMGDDLLRHAPELGWSLMLSGLVSLALALVAYWLLRRIGKRRWMEDNFAGKSVMRAEAMLEEIGNFERE
ncbi:hypothetical protein [Dyella subtropica]|uniref:hypothetical protein n=1 Tax=Dyella subtropica TaxID=2992127 RepID=UPI00224DD11A|nr:hypothetical protein [Dyella subtropica]